MTVEFEALDAAGKKAWQFKKEYPLAFSKEELDKILAETFTIEVEIGPLEPGAYTLKLALVNALDGGKIHRTAKISIKAEA